MQILPGLTEIPVNENGQQKTEKKSKSDMFSLLLAESTTEKKERKKEKAVGESKAENFSSLSSKKMSQQAEDSRNVKKSASSDEKHFAAQVEFFLLLLTELRSSQKGKQMKKELSLQGQAAQFKSDTQEQVAEFKSDLKKQAVLSGAKLKELSVASKSTPQEQAVEFKSDLKKQDVLSKNNFYQNVLEEVELLLREKGFDSAKRKALLADLFQSGKNLSGKISVENLEKKVVELLNRFSRLSSGEAFFHLDSGKKVPTQAITQNEIHLEEILVDIKKRWENALSKSGLSSEQAKELSARIEKDLRDVRYRQAFVSLREEKSMRDISSGKLGQENFSSFRENGGELLSQETGKINQPHILSEAGKRFDLPTHSVARQIEQGAFQDLQPGRRQLVLRLEPATLGSVMVMLRIKDKEVHAVLRTGSHEAARVIGEQAHQLRQSLESQGFRVARLDVEQDPNMQSDVGSGAWQQRKQQEDEAPGAWRRRLASQLQHENEPESHLSAVLEHELHNRTYQENFSSGVDIFA